MHLAWFMALAEVSGAGNSLPPLPWWRVAILCAIFAVLLGVWAMLNRRHWTQANFKRWLALAPQSTQIVVREQRWLNSKTFLCLVEVSGERFLLAQTQGSLSWQVLKKVPEPSSSDS